MDRLSVLATPEPKKTLEVFKTAFIDKSGTHLRYLAFENTLIADMPEKTHGHVHGLGLPEYIFKSHVADKILRDLVISGICGVIASYKNFKTVVKKRFGYLIAVTCLRIRDAIGGLVILIHAKRKIHAPDIFGSP